MLVIIYSKLLILAVRQKDTKSYRPPLDAGAQAPGLGRVGRAGSGLGQRRTALVTGARDPASAALLGCWKILG
jgi:hypothetical protein